MKTNETTTEYKAFSEVKSEIVKQIPELVYKYREWTNRYHQPLLTKNEIWFGHPNSMNDPYDVRPPYRFIPDEVRTPEFLQKMIDSVHTRYPDLVNDRDKRVVCENFRDIYILPDPEKYLRENYKNYVSGPHYDRFGILSTSTCGLDTTTWANYGGNHTGFCVGFSTIDLIEQFGCLYDYVQYSNDPITYSFLDKSFTEEGKELFYKSQQWAYEKEFRFLTLGIGVTGERLRVFNPSAVREVIVGRNVTPEHQQEIIHLVTSRFPGVPIYKATLNPDGFNFIKQQIA